MISTPLMRYTIEGPSMHPHLRPGDRIVATRRTKPRRHAVVVFLAAGNPIAKRVVALGDETVDIEGGVVLVDGKPFDDPWPGATRPDGRWKVPADAVFVLGDNRPRSDSDSRSMGPIPLGDVEAVVLGRYRPLLRR